MTCKLCGYEVPKNNPPVVIKDRIQVCPSCKKAIVPYGLGEKE
jgi:hypothetical protein